eukprot:3721418-Pleurochrysis_carterae.AAC.2
MPPYPAYCRPLLRLLLAFPARGRVRRLDLVELTLQRSLRGAESTLRSEGAGPPEHWPARRRG